MCHLAEGSGIVASLDKRIGDGTTLVGKPTF